MEQVAEAWTKPDDSLIPALSEPGCLSCRDLQETAQELVQKKRRYASNPVAIKSVTAVGDVAGQTQVRLLMTQLKVDVVDASGAVVMTDPRQELARTTAVVWRGDRWLLYDIA